MAKPQRKHTVKGISSKPYKGLNQTSVIDNITVIGERNVADARKGNDIITVKKGIYHTVKGGAGNDTITLKNVGWNGNNWNNWGDKDLAYGDAGNDKIYIKAGRHEVYGGTGNDAITIYASAQEKNVAYGEAGNDKITVKGGNYHTIYAGSSTKKGWDTIEINAGTETTVYGEEGVDKITVKGGRDHIIYGGEGKDVITVGSTKVKSKPSSVTVYGEEGVDKITVNKGDSHKVYTGNGKDEVIINGGSGHTIANKNEEWTEGFGGNDKIIVNKKAGNNMTIRGIDSSSERVEIYGGNDHSIRLGNGENQRIIIGGGKNHTITTGDDTDYITVQGKKTHAARIQTNGGDDTILVKTGAYVNNNNNGYWNMSLETGSGDDKVTIAADAGNGIGMKTEDGDDKIYIRGGKNHFAYTGKGDDIIEITGGSGHTIHLEEGSNKVTASAKNVTVNLRSNSQDNITLNWGTDRGLYTINANSNSSIALEDKLIIKANKESFTFSYSGSYWGADLLMTSTTDSSSKILINKWYYGGNPTAFDSIQFANGKMSFADINKKANLSF
jgi:Ca2+-binding RTX toxin-like protein